MDSVLPLTLRQRSELFIAAAQKSGIDVVVLEKDFWVCWTLKELIFQKSWIELQKKKQHNLASLISPFFRK
jgi:hypothetical protein